MTAHTRIVAASCQGHTIFWVDAHDGHSCEQQSRVPVAFQGTDAVESELHLHRPPGSDLMLPCLPDIVQLKHWCKKPLEHEDIEHVPCSSSLWSQHLTV